VVSQTNQPARRSLEACAASRTHNLRGGTVDAKYILKSFSHLACNIVVNLHLHVKCSQAWNQQQIDDFVCASCVLIYLQAVGMQHE